MGKNDDTLRVSMYVTAGVVATVAAGYLLWRFVLRDTETGDQVRRKVRAAGQAVSGLVSDGMQRLQQTGDVDKVQVRRRDEGSS